MGGSRAGGSSLFQDKSKLLELLLLPSDGAGTAVLQLGQLLQLQAVQPVGLLGSRQGARVSWGLLGRERGSPGGSERERSQPAEGPPEIALSPRQARRGGSPCKRRSPHSNRPGPRSFAESPPTY